MELEQNPFETAFAKKFFKAPVSLKRAEERRLELSGVPTCKYPIACLNDFLYGILPSELIVIGADTGIGKSWLANEFARVNALDKKKVYLFSLEGDDNEAIDRFRYNIIAKEYFKNPDGRDMSYTNYLLGKVTIDLEWDKKADDEIIQMGDYLEIYDKSEGLTIESLTQQMSNIKDADLVVIDHLHYFYFRDDKPESTQITEIMRRIKDLTEINHIPVVLVSHLRKADKDRGIPDNDDLMGSSNIAKIAKKTILLNLDYSISNGNKYATIIRVGKDSYGMKSNIGFLTKFDIFTNCYEDDYKMVRIKHDGKYEFLPEEEFNFSTRHSFKRLSKKTSSDHLWMDKE
jgi:replicative DNA helicase